MQKLIVRYSELATLMDCQLKYKLEYASGLLSTPSEKMALGSAFHALMQGHYESFRDDDEAGRPRSLPDARARGAERLTEYLRGPEGRLFHSPEMIATLRWMYEGYVDVYGTDDSFDKLLIIDEKRIVPLIKYKGIDVYLQCTADLVVRWVTPHGKAWLILDHKTRGKVDASKEPFKKENQLDPQRPLYAASFSLQGERKSRIPVMAAYHNIVRTDQLKRDMTLEERYSRSPVFYTENELNSVWEDAQTLAKRAVEIRLGVGPAIYASPDPQVCGWRCAYAQTHITARSTGRDIVQVAIDYGAKRNPDWKPLGAKEEPPDEL